METRPPGEKDGKPPPPPPPNPWLPNTEPPGPPPGIGAADLPGPFITAWPPGPGVIGLPSGPIIIGLPSGPFSTRIVPPFWPLFCPLVRGTTDRDGLSAAAALRVDLAGLD